MILVVFGDDFAADDWLRSSIFAVGQIYKNTRAIALADGSEILLRVIKDIHDAHDLAGMTFAAVIFDDSYKPPENWAACTEYLKARVRWPIRFPLTLVDNEDKAGRLPFQPGYKGPGQ